VIRFGPLGAIATEALGEQLDDFQEAVAAVMSASRRCP
jgi:hypothetical protein